MLAGKINFIFLFIAINLLFACSNDEINLNTLAKVYVDLSVAEDYYNNSDSLKTIKEEIFRKYSINEEVYKQSFLKFDANKEKWDEFYKIANTYLDTLKSDLKNSSEKIK